MMKNNNVSDALIKAEQRIKTLETLLRLQKEKLDCVMANIPDPTVVFNGDGTVDALNEAAHDMLERIGFDPDRIGELEKTVEFYDADDKIIPPWEVPPVRIMRGETLVRLRIKAKIGRDFSYIDFSGSPIFGEGGKIECAVMCFRNVTEEVDSAEHYDHLVASIQSGVIHHDANGTVISMNRAAEYITGKSSEELVGKHAPKPVIPHITPDGEVFPVSSKHPALVALRTGEPNHNTVIGVYNPRLQEYRWISITAIPLFRAGEYKPYQVFTVFNDITEQKKASDALVKSEARLRSVLESSNKLTYCFNVQTNIYEYISPASQRIFDFSPEEMMAMDMETVHAMIHPDDRNNFEKLLEKLIEDKSTAEITYRQQTKTGEYRWVTNMLSVTLDDAGRILYRNGIIRDVTEQKSLQDALREREMHLSLAAKGGHMGTYTFDIIEGKFHVSEELKALWGLRPDEPVELEKDTVFFRGIYPDDRQAYIDKINQANDPKGDGYLEMDYKYTRPDGVVKWLHARGQTLFAGEGDDRRPIYASGVVIDVTNRVNSENSIRELSGELRNVIESTDDFIWSVDMKYRLVLFNSAYQQYIWNKFRRRLKKGMSMKEILTQQSGALWEDLYVRTVKEGAFQIEMKIDKGAKIMNYSFHPVYIDSELIEITVFGKDVTDRLNSEREIIRLNTSLEKRVAERTEELQKAVRYQQNLTRILSHDLKEPIREIEAYTAQLEKNDDARPDALKIRETCAAMKRMIEDLSKYAMSAEHKINKEPVNVKNMVISIYNDLKSTMPNRSVLQFETGLPPVRADKALLQHVLLNLLSNAMKFSRHKELAEITVGCAEEDGQYEFHIRDNGVGFDMRYAHKLFNIFERLHMKEEFEGNGIGLAAVRNIIERHGGRTRIESEENVGTIVYFSLPVNGDN